LFPGPDVECEKEGTIGIKEHVKKQAEEIAKLKKHTEEIENLKMASEISRVYGFASGHSE
jgi:hypothetical protein